MISLPESFLSRMKNLLNEEYDDFILSYNESPVKGYRVNTAKISLSDFSRINTFGNNDIPYITNGFYLDYNKAGNHPYHHAGMIYIQEPAAMCPAECIDIDPSWHILDLCAAPGGKSTQLKNKSGDNSILLANEIIPSRCKILTGNIERLGLKNTITTCLDTNKLAFTMKNKFDLIMCDAPCSGEGMFRKDETAVNEWSENNVLLCAERQKEILENAAIILKNGGYIIYATCTFSLEENEMVIDSFLKEHPEFELIQVKDEILRHTSDGIFFDGCSTENISRCRRFYPHKSKGEGQFMAVLHNTLTCDLSADTVRRDNICTDKVLLNFLDETLTDFDQHNIKFRNGNPCIFKGNFDVPLNNIFSYGINIGEIKKNYIQPHHQFFTAMGKKFKRKINLNAEDNFLQKYLHGEEIQTDVSNGWAVVTVEGVPLGGVKVVNGTAKNHYPKGLRLKY